MHIINVLFGHKTVILCKKYNHFTVSLFNFLKIFLKVSEVDCGILYIKMYLLNFFKQLEKEQSLGLLVQSQQLQMKHVYSQDFC